jgi:hypothetical protein
MLLNIIFFLLIIIILTYYYYHYLQNHFWYNFGKNLGKNNKFYLGKLHPNIYSKNNLSESDKNKLLELYTNYLEGVTIDKEKIEDFLSIMPKSEIFYMKVNSILYGAVMNSIIEIKYKNKIFLSNFVDNAIINKKYRSKGIFKELMNYVSNYSNKMNVKYIIFKIDKKPIPSFYEYNLVSNYYYMTSFKEIIVKPCSTQLIITSHKNDSQFLKYNNSKNIIILSCPINEINKSHNYENNCENFGIDTFFKEKEITTMIFKKNTKESIELLYINNPDNQSIYNIMKYLFDNYKFNILFLDDIGNNSHILKIYPKSFKIGCPVYHYILGLKEKIKKENFFYYF